MDNVQKVNHCINIPSSWTSRSYSLGCLHLCLLMKTVMECKLSEQMTAFFWHLLWNINQLRQMRVFTNSCVDLTMSSFQQYFPVLCSILVRETRMIPIHELRTSSSVPVHYSKECCSKVLHWNQNVSWKLVQYKTYVTVFKGMITIMVHCSCMYL
jgi:hypothetical protein